MAKQNGNKTAAKNQQEAQKQAAGPVKEKETLQTEQTEQTEQQEPLKKEESTKEEKKPEPKNSGIFVEVVRGQVRHSGKVYNVGEKLKLSKEEAARLIDLGVAK